MKRIVISHLLAPVLLVAMLAGFADGRANEEQYSAGVVDKQGPLGASPEDDASKIAQILRDMSDFIAGAKSFGFTAHELIDEIEGGWRIQYSNSRSFLVRRPDRLLGEAAGDLFNRAFWYDGKSFSLLDRQFNSYFEVSAPENIDALLDHIEERLDLVVPLGEMLSRDIYQTLTKSIENATYVGLHQVRGVVCHHLAFTQEDLDWQLWVEASVTPVPRKLVIAYRTEPGVPQYSAVISRWDFTTKTPDALFKFRPPETARRVDLTVRAFDR
jgi:hypothetical protein